jgi:hypothetical protein
MHRRTDHPAPDERWRTRLLAGGVGTVWVRPDDERALPDSPQPTDLASA